MRLLRLAALLPGPALLAAPALAAEADEGGAFPAFETEWFAAQIFWLAIFFGLLYLVLSRGILPRVGETLERRSDTVASDTFEAGRLKGEADTAEAGAAKRVAEARANARAKAAATRAEVDELIREETDALDRKLDAELEEIETSIEANRQEAMGKLEEASADVAATMLRRLGVDPDPSAIREAVDAAAAAQKARVA